MARVTLYRDKRNGVISLRVNHNQSHASYALPIRIEDKYWKDGVVVNHPRQKHINATLTSLLSQAELNLLNLQMQENVRLMSAIEIKNRIVKDLLNDDRRSIKDFVAVFNEYTNKRKTDGSKKVYTDTLRRLLIKEPHPHYDTFTVKWFDGYVTYLKEKKYSDETIATQLRNIKSVLAYAISEGYTSNSAYKKFTFTPKKAHARDLSVEELRRIFNHKDEKNQVYLDIFKLQFFLIGINLIDLYELTQQSIERERIYYDRQKTDKAYNIKLEPEILEIINKYKGKDRLLNVFKKSNKKPMEAFKVQYNKYLHTLEKMLNIQTRMSSYVTRYSWASIASNDLDFSIDLISKALGHSFGQKVTQGYIHVNPKEIDRANRMMIDYVLYGKK